MKPTLLLLIRTAALACGLAALLAAVGCDSAPTAAPVTPPATITSAPPTIAPTAPPTASLGPLSAATVPPAPTVACTSPVLVDPLALTSMPGSVTSPYGIAWQAGRLYVPGRTSNNIGVVDGDKLSQVIPLDGPPTQIVADAQPGRLYLIANNQRDVSVLDGAQVRASLTVTNPRIANYQRVTSLALDAAHQRLFATVEADMAGIAIIDTGTFSIVRWLELPGSHYATRAVLDSSGARLLVASSSRIETVDIDTGRVTHTIALPSSSNFVLAPDPVTGRLFVDQGDGRSLAVIENGEIAASVPVGTEPHDALVVGRRLYVASSYSNTVSVIDLDTLGTVATVPVGVNPRALAADASGTAVYVASGDNYARIAVLDTRTNAVARVIPLVAQPGQLIADGTRQRLYALMPSSSEILVSDGQRVLTTTPLETAPSQMALDEPAGRLYVIDRVTNRLSIVDATSGRVLDRRDVSMVTLLTSVAVDAPNRRLFVNNDAFALDDLAPQGTYTITMYMYPNQPNLVPYRLVAEPASQRLYAVASNGTPGSNGGMVVYNIDTGNLRVQNQFGNINVFALAVDAPAQRAYVASSHPIEGISRVFAYDTTNFTYRVALPMPSLVTSLALNSRTGHLFAGRAGSFDRPQTVAPALDVLDVRTMGKVGTLPLGADPIDLAILGNTVFVAHRTGSTLSVVRDCAGAPPPAPTATATPEPYLSPTPLPAPTLAPTATAAPTETPAPTAAPTRTPTPLAACQLAMAPWATARGVQDAAMRDAYGCPSGTPQAVQLARQDFENGIMLWRADTRQIYVVYASGKWAAYADSWDSTQPEGGSETPPRPSLLAPKRGFGKVWREQLSNGADIGWATSEERAVTGAFQTLERGLALFGEPDSIWWLAADGTWR